jgi:hypothetical protein
LALCLRPLGAPQVGANAASFNGLRKLFRAIARFPI